MAVTYIPSPTLELNYPLVKHPILIAEPTIEPAG
jgi:hypothetical protein